MVGHEQVASAAVMATWARNQRPNESGFSPAQWVLGRNPRLPWSLLERPVKSNLASYSAAETEPSFVRRMAIYHAAKIGFERLDSNARLRRALLARSRALPTALEPPTSPIATPEAPESPSTLNF